ncbi:MAG: hypothetical protein KDB68_06070 [Planctomycetes bacterium]|nr:hypothetical protein [Planctomycetota bacterium]
MRKLLLAAGILMLGVGAVSTNLHAQDTPAKKADKENAKDAEVTKTSVYKATIAGMS